MPNMTFSLPDKLHQEMRAHPDIKWSEVARRAIQEEVERIHVYDRLLAGSNITERDAVEIGREIRRGRPKRRPRRLPRRLPRRGRS
ncbi:MAG: hypothetical protein ACT4PT_09165 [Methanobacteriota archaeon]